jgi:Mn2+/Fe2+ NRAMP family transporter
MFTLFLFVLVVYGADSIFYLLLKTKQQLSRYLMYCLVFIFSIPNYFFVFKDKIFLDCYDQKIPQFKLVQLILFIFILNLILILIGGIRDGGNM